MHDVPGNEVSSRVYSRDEGTDVLMGVREVSNEYSCNIHGWTLGDETSYFWVDTIIDS